MGDLGLNEDHLSIVNGYLSYSKVRRNRYVHSVDCLFQDVMEARLLESSYTVDEVRDMVQGLQELLRGEVSAALATASHMHVLLLQQLCSQAERWHLCLSVNLSELENSSLLEQARMLDDEQDLDTSVKTKTLPSRPASLPDEDGPVLLLHKEIARLTDKVADKQDELSVLQNKVVEEREAREAAERNLVQVQEKNAQQQRQLDLLEREVQRLQEMAHSASPIEDHRPEVQKLELELQKTMKALLEVTSKLQLAEQELGRKVSETSAFVNLRRMLDSKNEQLRQLRAQLSTLQIPEHASAVADE